MRRSRSTALRAAAGAVFLAAMGFGARQALATPAATASPAAACLREEAAWCNEECRTRLGPNYRGRCTKTSIGTISCECVQIFTP